jgi:hypothetical protein
MSRHARRWVIVSLVTWGLCVAAFAARLIVERTLGDLACEDPAGSSNYGEASWQWWYPGTRCAYEAADTSAGPVRAHVDRPSPHGAIAAIALIVWPIGTIGAARAAATRSTSQPFSA